MALTIGASRPARTITSNTASSAAESELPPWITGLMSSIASPNTGLAMRVSCARIQLLLPFSVLISPLWASMRKGWARRQVGKVLVE
jgi:hypothetical protein